MKQSISSKYHKKGLNKSLLQRHVNVKIMIIFVLFLEKLGIVIDGLKNLIQMSMHDEIHLNNWFTVFHKKNIFKTELNLEL